MSNMSKRLYFKYFYGRNCIKCAAQKTQEALKILGSKYEIKKYDAGETNGLAEASYYGVQSFPTLVLVMEYENGSSTETMLGFWSGILDIDETRSRDGKKIEEVLGENGL